jgi:hypothetical protein
MKTTMILPDSLMEKAKSHALKQGTSMTRLMENALREYLLAQNQKPKNTSWHIEPLGKGGFSSPDYEGNWPKIREALYEQK